MMIYLKNKEYLKKKFIATLVYSTALLLQQIPMASKFGRGMFQDIQTTHMCYGHIYINNRIIRVYSFLYHKFFRHS